MKGGRLWFFVSASSPKIEEMQREHGRVCLAYADPGKQDYVSISGSRQDDARPCPHGGTVVARGKSVVSERH